MQGSLEDTGTACGHHAACCEAQALGPHGFHVEPSGLCPTLACTVGNTAGLWERPGKDWSQDLGISSLLLEPSIRVHLARNKVTAQCF
jgi:hypothetical protein